MELYCLSDTLLLALGRLREFCGRFPMELRLKSFLLRYVSFVYMGRHAKNDKSGIRASDGPRHVLARY